ncbi:MAG TPA: hypothetical protein VL094_05685 [Sphingomonadaceae bacterium]|nr:hypothetical protein [Sphingomonadaceae bacterium]
MSYFVGQLVGGALAIAVLSILLRLIYRKFLAGNQLVFATVVSAVAVATFLYAFGSADGGTPKFGAGLVQYGIGGVIVAIFWLFRVRKRGGK